MECQCLIQRESIFTERKVTCLPFVLNLGSAHSLSGIVWVLIYSMKRHLLIDFF